MKTTPSRWPFRKRDGINHVEIAPRATTDNGEAALRSALDGAGIVRLSDMKLGEPVRCGLLVPLLADIHHTEPLPVSALYLAGRHPPAEGACLSRFSSRTVRFRPLAYPSEEPETTAGSSRSQA